MAINYTVAEVVEVLAEGKDREAIADIGKRYPILAIKVSEGLGAGGETFKNIFKAMPDYLTALKFNKVLGDFMEEGVINDEPLEDEVEEVVEEKPKKGKKETEEVEDESDEDEFETEEVEEEVVEEKPKSKKGRPAKKEKKVEKKTKKEKVEEVEEAEEESDDSEYSEMTAVQLFKLCKERGIKAPTKKESEFYIELLVTDDKVKADSAENDTEDEDDDWDI